MYVAEAALGDLAIAHDRASSQVAETGRIIASAQAEVARAEAKLASFDRRGSEIAARRDKLGVERTSLEQSQAAITARLSELLASIEDLRTGHQDALNDRQRHEETLAELKEQIRAYEASFEEAKPRCRPNVPGAGGARRDACGARRHRKRCQGHCRNRRSEPSRIGGRITSSAPAELTQALAGRHRTARSRASSSVIWNAAWPCSTISHWRAEVARRSLLYARTQPAAKVDALGTGAPEAHRFAADTRPEDEPLVRSLIGDAVVVVSDLSAALALWQGACARRA